ncbi:hypothetical protein [Saccharopolyspora sp. SCSIO 74807]
MTTRWMILGDRWDSRSALPRSGAVRMQRR